MRIEKKLGSMADGTDTTDGGFGKGRLVGLSLLHLHPTLVPKLCPSALVPKLYLGTHLFAKLYFAKIDVMRSRYRINQRLAAHFITATIVSWLPVFTTAARRDIFIQPFEYCRAHKGLKIPGLGKFWITIFTPSFLLLIFRGFSLI